MAGYIGNIPVPQGTQTRQNFTATASQTSFPTIGYTAGFIDVYLNGVKLINGTDFTATNGSDVVLTSAASASDVLDVVIFDTFDTSSGTFSDTTLKNNVTLKNDTEEDSDGGRASKIIYQGEQSGGEISTLAEIQASHDGTADDQKGDLIFKTNDGSDNNAPTERLRINSDGNMSLGSSSSSYKLFVKGTDSSDSGDVTVRLETGTVSSNSATNDLTLDLTARSKTSGGTAQAHNTEIRSLADASGNGGTLAFYTDNSSAAITERWRITKDGHFKAAANGNGIDFSATEGSGASSSILDDYEEGTFTPVMSDAASGGNTASVGVVIGRYTKVGQIVHVNIILANINSSGTTGGSAINIQGLPFAGANVTGISQHIGSVRTDSINVGSTCFGINFLISGGATVGQFYLNNDSAGDSQATWSDITASPYSDFFITGTYEI